MLKYLLKQQWKKMLLLVLFFCLTLMLSLADKAEDQSYWRKTLPYQAVYLEQFDLWDRDAFFEQLNADTVAASEVVSAIDYYVLVNGKLPEDAQDLADVLAGSGIYMDLELALWRDESLRAPGKLTDTVSNDHNMTVLLSGMLENQQSFVGIIDNHIERMRRAIQRGSSLTAEYEKALDQLERIEDDFPVANTYYVRRLLSYLEKDWHVLALVALCIFSVFSHANQRKVSDTILISPMGIRRYAFRQILVSLAVVISGVGLYYIGVAFVYGEGGISRIPWQHPIQTITGYEDVYWDWSVLDYIFVHMGIKLLFVLVIAALLLWISSLSPNNIVALIGALAICGGLIWVNQQFPELKNLLIGNCRLLVEDLCYMDVNGHLIPYGVVFSAGTVGVTAVILSFVVLMAPLGAGRWVR